MARRSGYSQDLRGAAEPRISQELRHRAGSDGRGAERKLGIGSTETLRMHLGQPDLAVCVGSYPRPNCAQ